MGKITFEYKDGSLGRVSDNEDGVSLIWDDGGTAPSTSAWAGKQINAFYSAQAAEESGINGVFLSHITEFFRIAGTGTKLFIGFGELTAETVYAATKGTVRQIGIQRLASEAGLLQAFANEMAERQAPLIVVMGVNASSISNLPNLRTLNCPAVACIASGNGHQGLGAYQPAYGLALGAISKSAVHECIGWVEKFNLLNDATLWYSLVMLPDGNLATSDNYAQLEEFGYITIKSYTGDTGAYFSDSPTAINANSDYSTIEHNRVIQKATRGVYKNLLPSVNSPIKINATTGKLDAVAVVYYQSRAEALLAKMASIGEISGYSVIIDDNQNVLATNRIEIGLKIIPIGVAREILVTLSLAAKI